LPIAGTTEVLVKRPILNRSSNGGQPYSGTVPDNVPSIAVRKVARRTPRAARAVMTGGADSGIPGLIDQPRAAISLPSSKSLASSVTALLQVAPVGAVGKRR
jgi:hypothetical protein